MPSGWGLSTPQERVLASLSVPLGWGFSESWHPSGVLGVYNIPPERVSVDLSTPLEGILAGLSISQEGVLTGLCAPQEGS